MAEGAGLVPRPSSRSRPGDLVSPIPWLRKWCLFIQNQQARPRAPTRQPPCRWSLIRVHRPRCADRTLAPAWPHTLLADSLASLPGIRQRPAQGWAHGGRVSLLEEAGRGPGPGSGPTRLGEPPLADRA